MKIAFAVIALSAIVAMLVFGWPLLIGLAIIGVIGMLVVWALTLLVMLFIDEATPEEIERVLEETKG
ncbi:hypothetical protein [Pseudoxanthomonas suwonensis]|uniref:hypothetical protein n=1 Tax=Pseudoxanthomonas suwonensis TaxID=314722 RepID=UPI00048EFB1F|nr:hypothetical protein [Pseudoxanthomonas suwonensis]